MPLQATSGAASYDAFGGGVAAVPNYIEDVFNSYLWTTSASNQTLTTGIDMTKGALTWIKSRSNAFSHVLQTGPGGGILPDNALSSNTTGAFFGGNYRIADSTTGFTMGTDYYTGTPQTAVVWTFRDQPKFKAQLTYTGNGGTLSVSHALGSKPGCIIIKKTSGAGDWLVISRKSDGNIYAMYLNSTAGQFYDGTEGSLWTSTSVSINWINSNVAGGFNDSGASYVMYLFAHNAGGFGLTGTDNVISCGSYTGNGSTSGPTVTLGYEPQWVMIKRTDSTGNWVMIDSMRGFVNSTTASPSDAYLVANTSAAESTWGDFTGTSNAAIPLATGFQIVTSTATLNANAGTYIYIAIRRGPMKVPTSGTSVFAPFYASYSEGAAITTNFPIDLSMWKGNVNYNWSWQDRLRGTPTSTGSGGPALASNSTAAETTAYQSVGITKLDSNTRGSVSYQADSSRSNAASYFMFRRAPSFFDEVCYTGNGASNNARTHNLGVAPELLIIKNRSADGSGDWYTFHTFTSSNFKKQLLSTSDAQTNYTYGSFLDAQPTSTTFTVNSGAGCNASGTTYVAYLFSTAGGVSKVGSYTGNGSTQQIDCGFTGGARFVMIKQTSGSGGDWYVYSSALGIVAGSDRTVFFNSSNASSAFGDTLDALSSGFELGPDSSSFGSNTSGATYIFLAIA